MIDHLASLAQSVVRAFLLNQMQERFLLAKDLRLAVYRKFQNVSLCLHSRLANFVKSVCFEHAILRIRYYCLSSESILD